MSFQWLKVSKRLFRKFFLTLLSAQLAAVFCFLFIFFKDFSLAQPSYLFWLYGGAILFSNILIVAFISLYFVGKCLASLKSIRKGLEMLKKEELGYRIKKEGDFLEFGKVIDELNSVIGKMEEKEKKARQRIEDLERFHELTVDRELKMKELKQENEKLKKQIKKNQSW